MAEIFRKTYSRLKYAEEAVKSWDDKSWTLSNFRAVDVYVYPSGEEEEYEYVAYELVVFDSPLDIVETNYDG